MIMSERLLYSVDDAMAQLSVSRTRVYELIRSGQLVSVKVGRRRLVPAVAIASYVDVLITGSEVPRGRAA